MKLKAIFSAILLAVVSLAASGQPQSPITWTENLEMTSETEGQIVFTAVVSNGWHMYSTDIPEGGPTPTSFDFRKIEGAQLIGGVEPSVKPTVVADEMFDNLMIGYWEGTVQFVQKFALAEGSKGCRFNVVVEAMACNDQSCNRPEKTPFEISFNAEALPESVQEEVATSEGSVVSALTSKPEWWKPVDIETGTDVGASWWYIFMWGFIGGLLALLTPCVWPMIPLTVSFFLKKNTSRKRSVLDALLYGGAIIVIYLSLGLFITLAFGATMLNELATNAYFNIAFFAILVVFAISFFGAFDIKLPAKWSNAMDGRAERTSGLISIFFMAFTLVLVSFSCTGPLIGTLLVEAATQGNIVGPAVGMGAFALALAIPFALFAMFPSLLKEMPRSGGWLNSVKVILGFLELALALKFLSVADLTCGWGILDREVFLSLWIVIFALLGLYLIGKIQFSHDSPLEYVSIPRFFLALTSFSFVVYMIPGLWGAPLKAISAFAPPLSTQDFNLYHEELDHFDNYDEGMAYAAEHGKPVLLDFSGYGCVNCREMEGAILDNSDVKTMIKDNCVFITLMVDDRTPLAEAKTIEYNGKKRPIETRGDLWGFLQEYKFHSSQQPYYVVLDNNGVPLTPMMGSSVDVEGFKNWLQAGLDNYKK